MSAFKKGQTVRATCSVQGLIKDQRYRVKLVSIDWFLGQGYTMLIIEDEKKQTLSINNPQIVLSTKLSQGDQS